MILSAVFYLFGALMAVWSKILGGFGQLIPDGLTNAFSYFISPVFKTFDMLAPVLFDHFAEAFIATLIFFASLYSLRVMIFFFNFVRGVHIDTYMENRANK